MTPTGSSTATAPMTIDHGTVGSRGKPTIRPINALRHRQAQNLMATLILAGGVPMITAGDELGRTQQGNNNAYCQDSPITWVHWDTEETWTDQTGYAQAAPAARRAWTLRPEYFRQGEFLLNAKGQPRGRKNIASFGGNNAEMTESEWRDATRRTLGMYLAYDNPDRATHEAFLIWFTLGLMPSRSSYRTGLGPRPTP